MNSLVGFVGLAALVLASCGSDDATSDTTPVPTPAPTSAPDDAETAGDPDGAWVATVAIVDGEPIDLIDGWDVTMTIEGDQVGGTAACNGYGGSASLGDDGSFASTGFNITEMGCQPEIQALEQSFVAALLAFADFEVDGDTLVLRGGGHEWTFERLAPIDDAAIVGTTWLLDTYLSGETATNTSAMADATLTLHDDGTLTGFTGCRGLEGQWIESGAEIVVTSLTAIDDPTAGVCATGWEELDNWVISVLEGGFSPTVDGNRLTIMAQGNEGLSYVAASDVDPALDPDGGVDGLVVYSSHRVSDGGEDALIEGALVFGSDGCIRIEGTVLLWPLGTRWQSDPPAVVAGVATFAEGDQLAVGGGFHDVDDLDPWLDNQDALERLRECAPRPGDGVFVIQHRFQPLSDG